MRVLLLTGLILAGTAGVAHAADGPGFFISPMGEPFRGPDAPNLWFDKADTNHDGALTEAEMEADAARFFATLDRGHDGEIDPEDLEYYETVLAPQIRVGEGGYARQRSEDDSSPDGPARTPAYVPQGAARFGYFDYPEPVIVADTNFNRGVDAREFKAAADKRFEALDKNGDGKIVKDELPRLERPSFARGGKRGGGRGGMRRGGGGHRGGGGWGGGMGPG